MTTPRAGPPAVAQGLVTLVHAHQQRVGIVVDTQLRIGEDLACLPGGDDVTDVLRSGGSSLDRSAGSGPGNPDAVLESDAQVGDSIDGGAGRFDVEEVMDAVPAARGITGRYRGPQMTVLNGEGNQAPGPAGDVPGQVVDGVWD
ncbi:hypothetical protein [Streptomyces sp. NPDC088348]|uniref:hypothetical protein n=1 Tax=Streptomyces sp. NPDC088348 TaxID=3365853 RepID=UPI003817B5F3